MKIVGTSNFDRDTINDILVCENVQEPWGEFIVRALNNQFGGELATYYFRMKPDDYVLYKWEP